MKISRANLSNCDLFSLCINLLNLGKWKAGKLYSSINTLCVNLRCIGKDFQSSMYEFNSMEIMFILPPKKSSPKIPRKIKARSRKALIVT